MAKEYFVELGNKSRLIRFTRQERVEIEARFNCDIRTFVYEMAFPVKDGKPTLGGRLEAQEALIFYGLRHNGPKITEDAVSRWLQDAVEKPGGSVYVALSQTIVGLLASGLLGWTPKLADNDDSSDEGSDTGKAQAGEGPAKVEPLKRTG